MHRNVHALERDHPSGPLPEFLDDAARLDHRVCRHRASTMAGSSRVTLMIADTAESAHMASVSANRPASSAGVTTIGSAVSAVATTTRRAQPVAIAYPIAAL